VGVWWGVWDGWVDGREGGLRWVVEEAVGVGGEVEVAEGGHPEGLEGGWVEGC